MSMINLLALDTIIPAELLCPGGTLQMMMECISFNSYMSIPFLDMGASLACLGNVMGVNYITECGHRANLYVMGIAPSGYGKDAPFHNLPLIIDQTNARKILGPTEVTSSKAALRGLGRPDGRICFMMLDVIWFIHLKKLFSGTNRGEAFETPNHHMSFYGACTPIQFLESVSKVKIEETIMPKILIFESTQRSKDKEYVYNPYVSPELINRINDIYGTQETETPVPKVIPMSSDSKAYFSNCKKKYFRSRHGSKAILEIHHQSKVHAVKIALIHAVSLHGSETMQIGIESVEWACELVNHVTKHMIKRYKQVNKRL